MSLQQHIKLSLYNKGKQDSKQLFESKAKLLSLSKEKNYLNKTLESYSLNENLLNSFLLSSKPWDDNLPRTTQSPIFSSKPWDDIIPQRTQLCNCHNQHLDYVENSPYPSENDWLSPIKYLDFLQIENASDIFSICKNQSADINIFCKPTKNKASEINDEIRKLKLEVKKFSCIRLFLRIKELVQELHSLVTFSLHKLKKVLKKLEKSLILSDSVDLRDLFRNRVRCLFKYFSDFSGSEEDSIAHIILSNKNFFNLINRNACTIKM